MPHSGVGRGVDQADQAEIRRLSLFQPHPQLIPFGYAVERALAGGVGEGRRSRCIRVGHAFFASHQGLTDLPADEEPASKLLLGQTKFESS